MGRQCIASSGWPKGWNATTLAIARFTNQSKMNADAANENKDPTPSQAGGRRLVEVLLIVLAFFALAGDPPPNVNESHYLCRLKHFWDPSWCVGDLFLESADTQTVFIWLFGWITRFASLATTAWIGRLLAWALIAWGWQTLSWRVVPKPFASVLSAALFVTLNARFQLAGEWIVGGVEAKCFAYGLVLFALRELVDLRWNRMFLLLGAATAFHPLAGGWSAIVCGALWLFTYVRRVLPGVSRRDSYGDTTGATREPFPILGLIGGGLLALIGVVPALSLTWDEPPEIAAKASQIYVFERLPHHLALLSLPAEEVRARLLRYAVLLVALAALGIAMRRHAVIHMVRFAWGAALLAAVGLVIELVLSHEPQAAARLLRYYWYRLADFAAPMAVALAATALVMMGMKQGRPLGVWLLIASIAFSGWHLALPTRQRLLNPVPPADARMANYGAWVDLCEWVAENTSANALFLTPRLNHSFKWRTGRPEVVNRKDIPQDARGIVEWDRRIKDIYYYEAPWGLAGPIDSLGQLGDDRVRELANKYGADYVLSDRSQLLTLPRAYWNEEYVVYRIDHGTAGDEP